MSCYEEEPKTFTPLELRLEISKGIPNLRFDLLKRTYNRQAVIEGYEKGDVDIHIHFSTGGIDTEVEKQSIPRIEWVCRLCRFRNVHSGLMRAENEVPMLIWIGIGSEPFRPIDSVVRLQPLNRCHMVIVDELEVGITPSPKTVLRVLYRELSGVLLAAGIKNSELVDQIVETTPKAVQGFPNEQGHFGGYRELGTVELQNIHRLASGNELAKLRIYAKGFDSSLQLFVDDSGIKHHQLRKTFFCPTKPDVSAIKRMHDACILAAKSTSD